MYGKDEIVERHRHRYEVNNLYRKQLESAGVIVSGVHEELDLVEVIELKNHDYFVACQFHPEFRNRPNNIHPLFRGFVKASAKSRASKGR